MNKKTLLLLFSLIFFLLVFVLSFFVWKYYNIKQKQEIIYNQQQEIIETLENIKKTNTKQDITKNFEDSQFDNFEQKLQPNFKNNFFEDDFFGEFNKDIFEQFNNNSLFKNRIDNFNNFNRQWNYRKFSNFYIENGKKFGYSLEQQGSNISWFISSKDNNKLDKIKEKLDKIWLQTSKKEDKLLFEWKNIDINNILDILNNKENIKEKDAITF